MFGLPGISFYNNIRSRLTVVSLVANKSSHIITTEVYILLVHCIQYRQLNQLPVLYTMYLLIKMEDGDGVDTCPSKKCEKFCQLPEDAKLLTQNYLLVELITGHSDVGTLLENILQFIQVVEPLIRVYDPCGQILHGSYPVEE